MKLYARTYQFILRCGSNLINWSAPNIIVGKNTYEELKIALSENKHQSILIITDRQLMKLNLLEMLLNILDKSNIKYYIYSKTVPNPTSRNVEDAVHLYHENNCDGIIAFGGGSPMDCAKAVGARIARPKKPLHKMKGLLRVRRKLPILYAIPTTAGTGSETTIASVITDETTHKKYVINDFSLMPRYVVLDTVLTLKLPPNITANTGMDALMHAVEAYIGKSNTKETITDALNAISFIHENLYKVYLNGKDFDRREKMLLASFYAGRAFTRAYVGNIHAIAHRLGEFYSIQHGLAVSVTSPYVLRYYGKSAEKNLACLASHLGIAEYNDTQALKSEKFIGWIEKMNNDMKIPKTFSEIKTEDIATMADRAYHEANPLYPVPMIFNKKDFEQIYLSMKKLS